MKEASLKRLHTPAFHLYDIFGKGKTQERRTNEWLQGVGWRRGKYKENKTRGRNLGRGVDRTVLYLDFGAYVKIHKTICQKE